MQPKDPKKSQTIVTTAHLDDLNTVDNINSIDNIDVMQWRPILKKFVNDRNWEPYHNVKNLSMNLVNEASELMEIFTWKNHADMDKVISDPATNAHIREEIGDVLMTLIMLAEEMDINLSAALAEKVKLTALKYPAVK